MFFKLGDIKPDSNKGNDYTARQLQSVEVGQAARPCPVTFVKLVLTKNYQNKKNQYNQVRFPWPTPRSASLASTCSARRARPRTAPGSGTGTCSRPMTTSPS